MSDEQAVVKVEKTPIAMDGTGVVLKTLDDCWRLSEWIAATPFAPEGMSAATIVVSIIHGMKLRISPVDAPHAIAVINRRPCLYGDYLLAVCQREASFDHSVFDEHHEGVEGEDSYQASCTVSRVGGRPHTETYSIGRARRARLWEKAGPWTNDPKRMLQMRARAYALRHSFADALKGFGFVEEVRDYDTTGGQDDTIYGKAAELHQQLTCVDVQDVTDPAATPDEAVSVGARAGVAGAVRGGVPPVHSSTDASAVREPQPVVGAGADGGPAVDGPPADAQGQELMFAGGFDAADTAEAPQALAGGWRAPIKYMANEYRIPLEDAEASVDLWRSVYELDPQQDPPLDKLRELMALIKGQELKVVQGAGS